MTEIRGMKSALLIRSSAACIAVFILRCMVKYSSLAVHNVVCTPCIVHCSLYTVCYDCTHQNIHITLRIIHCTYTIQRTLYIVKLQCTVHCAGCVAGVHCEQTVYTGDE